jgi:ATP-dependent DNA ligase
LDGEIVVLDEQGVPRFELLQRFQRDQKGALIYFVFDLLYLNGEDLTGVPPGTQARDLEGALAEGGSNPIQRCH